MSSLTQLLSEKDKNIAEQAAVRKAIHNLVSGVLFMKKVQPDPGSSPDIAAKLRANAVILQDTEVLPYIDAVTRAADTAIASEPVKEFLDGNIVVSLYGYNPFLIPTYQLKARRFSGLETGPDLNGELYLKPIRSSSSWSNDLDFTSISSSLKVVLHVEYKKAPSGVTAANFDPNKVTYTKGSISYDNSDPLVEAQEPTTALPIAEPALPEEDDEPTPLGGYDATAPALPSGGIPTLGATVTTGTQGEINNAVASKAVQSINAVIGTLSSACQVLTKQFLFLLMTTIEAMEKVLDVLDGMKKEVDDAYDDMAPFPPLPKFPEFPPLEIPTVDTDDLDCPIAECFGLPNPPAVKFPVGLPPNPTQEIIAQFEEYTQAVSSMTEMFQTSVGANVEIMAKNAKKALQNAPQALLNGIVDGVKGTIASMVSETAMGQLDAFIECLIEKDARFATTEEIVRYKELRSRIKADATGKPDVSAFLGKAKGQIDAFSAKKDAITNKLKAATDFKSLGSGATSLIPSNPLSSFKSPF